ncbi:unnamed protein product [Arctogadus glacialis]
MHSIEMSMYLNMGLDHTSIPGIPFVRGSFSERCDFESNFKRELRLVLRAASPEMSGAVAASHATCEPPVLV